MSQPIEDYALIGDAHTAALVGRDGSIDWLCLPRFDSGAVFAALLGDESNGRWSLAPEGGVRHISRRYRGDSLVLETTFETEDGSVRVVDCMPRRHRHANVVRVVEGIAGRVPMRMHLVMRFDYGWVVPWVRRMDDCLTALAGPDALCLRGDVESRGEDLTTVAQFAVAAGERVRFALTWHPSVEASPSAFDIDAAVTATEIGWQDWANRGTYAGPRRDLVVRSLVTLKAMTYEPSDAIVAAVTTSVPERAGGVRNWDYRYTWLRDATFTLFALANGGYMGEARAWRDWLLRAVAGDPAQLQIMYGVSGERRLPELEMPWLPGYESSRPVRLGNAAAGQFQLDVYGEVMDALHQVRRGGDPPDPAAWALQRALLEFVESHWIEPDNGIWEVRGGREHFTHSKVMAWVAIDRAVKAVEQFGLDGPLEQWKKLRGEIHHDVCDKAFDTERNTFTQSYGSRQLDASLLLMPLVGFLPPTDERVRGTVEAIERELVRDGFVMRYSSGEVTPVDGLPPGEGVFLACSFWLADNLVLLGRNDDARTLCDRVVGLCNDVGLLSEQYDPTSGHLLGNFPQAFSHVGLVNTMHNLARARGPAVQRMET